VLLLGVFVPLWGPCAALGCPQSRSFRTAYKGARSTLFPRAPPGRRCWRGGVRLQIAANSNVAKSTGLRTQQANMSLGASDYLGWAHPVEAPVEAGALW